MIAPVPRARLWLSLVLALGAGSWATAIAAAPRLPLDEPLLADLDGDGVNETVRAHETACFTAKGERQPPCKKDALRTLFVEVVDDCAAGTTARRLSREMEAVSLARIIDADGDGKARELAFELRAGATGRGMQAKVVSFQAGPGGCVAVRRTLFSYPRPDTIGRRPKGTSFATGALAIRDFAPGMPGLELRTRETYARPTDAGCCPSHSRVTYWRFVVAHAGYTPYRTKLTKLPRQA
jgi:hypothetical protein